MRQFLPRADVRVSATAITTIIQLNVRLEPLRNMHHLLHMKMLLMLVMLLLQLMLLELLLLLHLLRRRLLMGTMTLIATESITGIETKSHFRKSQGLLRCHCSLLTGLELLVVHSLGVDPGTELT